MDEPPRPLTRRRVALALVAALAVFLALRLGWAAPRVLPAEEADTIEAGVDLAAALTDDAEPLGLKARLVKGFATHESNPRLEDAEPDQDNRRAVLEAPVPRWLAALGIAALPGADDTPNLARTAASSALAVAAAILILWLALRRRAWLAAPLLLLLPGVLDAGVSAGYGAAALLVMSALAAAVDGLVARGRGVLLTGLCLGLAAGVHPLAIALVVAVFVAYAIAAGAERLPSAAVAGDADPILAPPDGTALRLPSAPLLFFALPILAVLVLVAVWPALWHATGNRFGAWIGDLGTTQQLPAEVAGHLIDQRFGRASGAWTALIQWVAWTPLPVVALFALGLLRAVRAGRGASWFPIVAWATLIVVGALEGSLFGGRQALLPLLWVPTALVAAGGAELAWAWLAARVRPAPRVVLALGLTVLLAAQAAADTTLGVATQTGSELRYGLPLALLDEVAARDPGATVAVIPLTQDWEPQVDAAHAHLGLDVLSSTPREARWIIAAGDHLDALAGDIVPRLAHATEIMRDASGGMPLVLWRVDPRH